LPAQTRMCICAGVYNCSVWIHWICYAILASTKDKWSPL